MEEKRRGEERRGGKGMRREEERERKEKKVMVLYASPLIHDLQSPYCPQAHSCLPTACYKPGNEEEELGLGTTICVCCGVRTVSLCAPLHEQQDPSVALAGHVVFRTQRSQSREAGESLQGETHHGASLALSTSTWF